MEQSFIKTFAIANSWIMMFLNKSIIMWVINYKYYTIITPPSFLRFTCREVKDYLNKLKRD